MFSFKIALFVLGAVHLSTALICPGCAREQNVNDPVIKKNLDSALLRNPSLPEGTDNEKVEVVKIENVSSQVMSGIKYTYDFEAKGVNTKKLYECHIVFHSQKWLGRETISELSCKPLTSRRSKRSLTGGEVELNDIENNDYLLSIKDSICLELTKQQKSDYLLGIVKFFKASQQIVAGILTKITAEVAKTDCLLTEKLAGKCEAEFEEKGHKVCNFEVWEKPWLNERTVAIKGCTDVPYFCAGCSVELSPNNEQANLCLKRTLFNLNTKSHSKKEWKLQKILKIQSQIVAGIKYTIEFEAEDEISAAFICKAVIVSQPWLSQEPTVEDFQCVPEAQS